MSLPAELLLVSVPIVLNGIFVMSEMAIVERLRSKAKLAR